jgi:putative colanic acid biosynthesis acetyltransferase WcaF
MRLERFSAAGFDRGAPRWKEALWLAVDGLLVSSWLPGSAWRVTLLRSFGARIGHGVRIKPRVQVKFPWRLTVGDHSWIGEGVWIDNLADVRIGADVCLSQGAYLCTGSHDWARESFDLIVKPIVIGPSAWVCARAVLAPGTVLEPGAVVGLGAVARGQLASWQIHAGNPAQPGKARPRPAD